MSIRPRIVSSFEEINWANQSLNGIEAPTSRRNRVALGSLHLAMEHGEAIPILIASGLIGSASSLLRPMLEAYVRGVWFSYRASEDQLTEFTQEICPSLSLLLGEVEKVEGYDTGLFSSIREKHLKILHSLTHGGFVQIVRRQDGEGVAANYDADEIDETLEFSQALRRCCAVAVCGIVNRPDIAAEFLERVVSQATNHQS